jgi:hypothetical protein
MLRVGFETTISVFERAKTFRQFYILWSELKFAVSHADRARVYEPFIERRSSNTRVGTLIMATLL